MGIIEYNSNLYSVIVARCRNYRVTVKKGILKIKN